ncbi:Non-specific phospholipase C4 [Hibiscus syriacus]|uniref:Non-specific phospholipase C4 n=1 Tax=Hibiscus syriacus TaxID=106335 RepID=A0A6A3BAV9_HIBSY|nr:non-specific phospholipase C3-like isoform X1 [Hibiscus syriacus]KAE8713311.1 Non-specific phospholipase C4 [Hibiscus syriacus]
MAAQTTPSPIKTVVVLVQENRSFDHMLGWFKTLNPEIDGVTGSESNPISTSGPTSTHFTFKDTAAYVDPNPDHSFQAIYEQVSGKPWDFNNPDPNPEIKMNGFVQNAERTTPGLSETVMNGFKPEMVPVFKELVTEFAVCDRWFASLPTSTQSNRLYLHSATSRGAMSNDTQKLIEGYPQKTIFESLEENGYTFGIYHQSFPATLFYRNLRNVKYVDNFSNYDLSFKRDCKNGKLPNYVVIEPRYFDILTAGANDDHPSHDVSEGQKFVKEIYEALRSSPQWNEILFLITYDEHGGFYDHVPTPTGVPSPDDIVSSGPYNFKFDRLGCRVPAILVSPWIEPGTVLHRPSGPHPTSEFEHSSIPATVKKIFNLKEFLTKRDAWAGSFDIVVNRSTPRTDCPEKLAEPVKMRHTDAKETAKLSDFQQELVQVATALKGDPLKVVDNMTVSSGLKYVEDAFSKFYDGGKKAKKINGVDDIVSAVASGAKTSTTFVKNIFS